MNAGEDCALKIMDQREPEHAELFRQETRLLRMLQWGVVGLHNVQHNASNSNTSSVIMSPTGGGGGGGGTSLAGGVTSPSSGGGQHRPKHLNMSVGGSIKAGPGLNMNISALASMRGSGASSLFQIFTD